MALAGGGPNDAIIDVGGGASGLVDALVDRKYRDLTVLDISGAALSIVRKRLGPVGDGVALIEADITRWQPQRRFDIWHDRAAFHFLTRPEDQAAYIRNLLAGLRSGGHIVLATFAPDGPEKCSGLDTVRHDAESLAKLLGPRFDLLHSRKHDHETPWGAVQRF
ncbi:class I SAM-dependent methyltransferase [Tardiphaga alba]|uniref:Class I SAM-dependent methyltransferase n=2 Tax=Tardiphaga alba TaxID=340268 RepID=A0ABX8AH12_9BRAD|nr:class I SAM-dependent methyltransferase [Tardiphaga alba]